MVAQKNRLHVATQYALVEVKEDPARSVGLYVEHYAYEGQPELQVGGLFAVKVQVLYVGNPAY